ncbi:PH and SEC7 domain-containing protein [Patella vulgata]|uniref:PH and SEC7 domain-containing protein n=1 Tax=Patella vulgata TaxID=6465 RepID=UPI0021809708|nr:PH and SEC7 domain-containing protein [Patella vulgata]
MASRTTASPSRIPVSTRSPPRTINGKLTVKEARQACTPSSSRNDSYNQACQNGSLNESTSSTGSTNSQKGKGFETFLMTGDMIIRTTPPHQKTRQSDDKSPSPSIASSQSSPEKFIYHSDEKENINKMNSEKHKSPQKIPVHKSSNIKPDLPRAPVARLDEMTEFSISPTDCDIPDVTELENNKNLSENKQICLDMLMTGKNANLDGLIALNGNHNSETTDTDIPSSGDSGVLPDSHSSDSDCGGKLTPNTDQNPVPNADSKPAMVTSKSAEKISPSATKTDIGLVRTSKSHENYLETGTGFQIVSIDIDDDNMAYSLDTLTCHESSTNSLEKVSDQTQVSKSCHSSPERKQDKKNERVFMPAFINIDDPKSQKNKGKEKDGREQLTEESVSVSFNNSNKQSDNSVSPSINTAQQDMNSSCREGVLDLSALSEADSIYHQPMKSVDRPSAARLAKRLYALDGFRKSDVSRHLFKKNEFSNLVAEEYLKYFQFTGDSLDVSLRKFLKQFCLTGETQERERVLAHFSHRYMECNPGTFNSEDACHTLTCAIMLLNTDLHGQSVGRKMTCSEFIENLGELNDGDNFPKDILKTIFHSIKSEPLEWAIDEDAPVEVQNESPGPSASVPQHFIGQNPFLDVPDPSKTIEYKKGYVMRKCCMDADRRRTALGKRSWKMFYAVLRDMILYLYKDEHQYKKGGLLESASNAIRVHHSLVTKASDYTKKQHVFRLQTAEWAEFLFQTSNSKELQEWIDTLNFVAATFSAQPLPGALGSKSTFQRPLLPVSYTRKTLREQFHSHEEQVKSLEQEIHEHHAAAPEKGAKSRHIQDYLEKETYLDFELKRYKTYVYLLQSKITAFPDVEPSLVETTIGEDEEVGAGGSQFNCPNKPVQRSLSDREVDDKEQYINDETIDTYL